MDDCKPRQVVKTNCLACHGEDTRDHRLACNNSCQCGKDDHRDDPARGNQSVERLVLSDGCRVRRMSNDPCSLTEVIQQQTWPDHRKPTNADWSDAKVPNVHVERFGACHHKNDGTQQEKCPKGVRRDQFNGVDRVDRRQHARIRNKSPRAEEPKHSKPNQHQWSKDATDVTRAKSLHTKQQDQYDRGQGCHPALQTFIKGSQAFHCRENRDGRGNHAITKEQRSTDDCERTKESQSVIRAPLKSARQQREQCKQPALAAIRCTHDQQLVLRHHHDKERPEDQTENAHHEGAIGTAVVGDRFRQGVKRAGSNITKHHPNGTDCQCHETGVTFAWSAERSMWFSMKRGRISTRWGAIHHRRHEGCCRSVMFWACVGGVFWHVRCLRMGGGGTLYFVCLCNKSRH